MSVCDSASVDIERDGKIAAGESATISKTAFSPCIPQANSTVVDTILKDAEQYLGSDDPDNDDVNIKARPTKEIQLQSSGNFTFTFTFIKVVK